MATIESVPQQPLDRPRHRRPFSTWMRKLANLKGSSSADTDGSSNSKKNTYPMKSQSKKQSVAKNNNPYMTSNRLNGSSTAPVNGHLSFSTVPTRRTASISSLDHHSRQSFHSSVDGIAPSTMVGNRSIAPTLSTEPDFARSDAAPSHGASSGEGTATIGGGLSTGRGADSTFSSPEPSLRSLTTTLTTIHSTTTNLNPASGNQAPTSNAQSQNQVQFSHQFPTSPPATAIPAHLNPQAPSGHPTYSHATANNLLTDNASILTLASSSKRRRRRSMDTDASIRALAPSSLWGGSRESLPLSVLSANVDSSATTTVHQARQATGTGANERASLYSATGVAPALPSERNSYYAGKQNIMGDGGSVKSGLLGHGRTDSVSGSIAGVNTGSPLASPKESVAPTPAGGLGRLSRQNSHWGEGETNPNGEVEEKPEEEEKEGLELAKRDQEQLEDVEKVEEQRI